MAAAKRIEAPTILPRRGLVFTRNGKPISRIIPMPPGANDLRLFWRNGVLIYAYWTKNGIPLGRPIPVPRGANDVHLKVG